MKLILSLSLLFLIGCGGSGNSHRYDDLPDNNAIKVWNVSSFPLTVRVPNELLEHQTAIINAGQSWDDAMGFQVFNFVFNNPVNTQWTNTRDMLFDSFFGLFKQLAWSFSNVNSSTLAFTSTLSQNSVLLHSDIVFNFQHFSFLDVDNRPGSGYCATASPGCIDFESVLVHELGHFLGLNHVQTTEDPSSIMNPTLGSNSKKRIPSTGDVSRIRFYYGQ